MADGGTYVDPRLHPALLSRRATQTQKSLSKREREIMDLLAQGLTGEQVAERLFLSPETIKTHIRNAMSSSRPTPACTRSPSPCARASSRRRPTPPAGRERRDLVLDAEARRRLRHDLRTPLTIVAGFAEVLAGDRPMSDDDRKDFATRIVNAAGEIRDLIDQALE